MKEQLEMIPVWDGVKSGSECFICDLMKVAEDDSLSYYLGPAIMVPEIRVVINRKGFCPHHFAALAEKNKAQPLALVCDTYYEESKNSFASAFAQIEKASNARKAVKGFEALEAAIEGREAGCLVCEHMEIRLKRYCETVAALYEEDASFREALAASKGFCTHHTIELYHYSKNVLKGDVLADYLKLLASLLQKNLDRVQHDAWWMTQKYKSENKDKSWDGCEDAYKRAALKITGEGRLLSK